ncbi:23S rRNA (guanosine(2251)-2'-O)-methyltransferase RlmB [Blattabacterium punctulatus]|uniref:23S rRNA (guanosine(2251)-2'-O)-methyltransferase RlmB n=1 Tax=Blattabacterium punctulatus TaxID=164514 RepID=UPI000D7B9A8A|nr:23S rRNA (guanosine(2251)-2'-O)-methyltransferase RlmB [Blattabacterium punctulatus]AWU42925.1 23S rRNA (guanosine(2251)-2'-O)-methyltransferase RlmB [Blattabacterium punctulatus]AWU43466.1 23S rRNA (guanosine(2251)-2'-O)-methyltransferase RlmB [Blattabacterium punctulatus]AWU46202.1 23S rRNA (guanosine(2251)-2'-O)-methyltransferase RlmB [Blattabacterium punctulatus]
MSKLKVIYGIHPLIEAIQSKITIKKLFFQIGWEQGANIYKKKLINLSKKNNIQIHSVSKKKFDQWKNKNHQGVFAILSPIKTYHIEDLLPIFYEKGKNPLLLILDRITDVRNFGSIIRTAVCAGVDSIIIPKKDMAMIGSDSIKTSSGALFKVPICKEKNIGKTIEYLIKSGLKIVSATEKSNKYWYDIDFSFPTALILGNEENGISRKYLELSYEKAKIPLIKGISSLNVSVACGIILYEIVRQRKNIIK